MLEARQRGEVPVPDDGQQVIGLNGRITISPDVCNGKLTLRGTRITVESVLGYLAAGDSAEEILEEFQALDPADIKAALAEWT